MSKIAKATARPKGYNRKKKEGIVDELSVKVAKAKALVFTNYQGLTHQQLEKLKKALRAANAELVIAKNSLLLRALQSTEKKSSAVVGSRSTVDILVGPTATLLAYEDIVLPLKALAKTIKELKLPIIKFGILDGEMLAAGDIDRLSLLPPKEVLLAQLVGGLKAPIYGLHRALNWNLQRLVMTLSAIQQKKS